jgi:hypothetical protein
VWANLVFGGIPGLAVDAITGGLYKVAPEEVTATLKEAQPAGNATSPQPAGSTAGADPDDAEPGCPLP